MNRYADPMLKVYLVIAADSMHPLGVYATIEPAQAHLRRIHELLGKASNAFGISEVEVMEAFPGIQKVYEVARNMPLAVPA